MFKIEMFEEDNGTLSSLGFLPGKFVTMQQAVLKIKTLDRAYEYRVIPCKEEVTNVFKKSMHIFCIQYYNPVEDATIQTTISRKKTDLWVSGEHLKEFNTYQECKDALTGLGLTSKGLD